MAAEEAVENDESLIALTTHFAQVLIAADIDVMLPACSNNYCTGPV